MREKFMRAALREAEKAARDGEVPIGAVLVIDGKIVACGHNRNIKLNDPTAHAEIIVLRRAAKKVGNYRLTDAEVYVTLEPCPMCAGALVNARVKRLIYGASDPKAGAVKTLFQICTHPALNHRLQVEGGLLADESIRLLRAFFKGRRGGSHP